VLVATITEVKNRLSALIDHVRAGESVLIVDRGIPVARLESAVSLTEDAGGRIARLQRAGAVRPATKRPATELVATRPPRARKGASAVGALLAERREAR